MEAADHQYPAQTLKLHVGQLLSQTFSHTALSIEKKPSPVFMTTRQVFRLSVSVDGPITERGADIVIIDDPLKPEDALSDSLERTGFNDCPDWISAVNLLM